MENFNLKRFALILAVQSEIDGMKAENIDRCNKDLAIAYTEDAFNNCAGKLRDLAYCHDDQL